MVFFITILASFLSANLHQLLFLVYCRLDTKYPLCNMFKLFMCAVCQVEVKPGEGVSIHAGSSNCRKLRPWDGPFLCASCQDKKDAMEGKRSSGGTYFFLYSLPIFCDCM